MRPAGGAAPEDERAEASAARDGTAVPQAALTLDTRPMVIDRTPRRGLQVTTRGVSAAVQQAQR